MPNANGKTSLGLGDYKIGPNNGGFSNFSDDFGVGFTPLITEKFNELTEDATQYTQQALSYGFRETFGNNPETDFFDDELGGHVGFNDNASPLISFYKRTQNTIIFHGNQNSGYNYYENNGNLPNVPNAFDEPNQPLQPTENLEERQSVYNNPGGPNENIFASSVLPGQVKEGQPNYDSYNELPEPLLNRFQQFGSRFGTEGLVADRPEPPSAPNFAEMAFQSNQAINNAQGGGIESIVKESPQGLNQLAVGMGIEATGGGSQNLDALAQEMSVEDTLDTALNNINPDFNNNMSGIL